jgi:UDPglucose 6-dehydrogenase
MIFENEGAKIRAYDPQAMEATARMVSHITLCKNPYEVADGADALILATEWNEFKHLDFNRIHASMNQPIILDGRNLWDPEQMRQIGFQYLGCGIGNTKKTA